MEKLKEFVKQNQNKILIGILVFIILLQVLLRIEYGFEKAYLHIDEGYSYGLMNYDKIDIMDNEDFYNTWHKNEYYKDYLSISSKEAMDFTPVYENQKNDVHPPFYYLLLRIASSFTIDSFSKWTGIVLNIVIFILTSIFIYLIANRIFKSKIYAVFMVLVNGFTLASIDTTIFIRMYALNALNLLIIAYLHIKNANKDKLSCKELAIMSIAIIIGSLTHYYYLVFLFILFVMYLIKFIKQKNTKNILRYVSMIIISAIISLAIFPYSFVHMFMGYRGTGAISSLTNINQMWNSFRTYCNILCDNVFNGILLFMVVVSVAVVGYHFIKNKKLSIKFENKEFWLMFIPSVIYFAMVALVSPYQEIRYIMPVCPLLIIGMFYLFKVSLETVWNQKNTYQILSVSFILMLILPSIVKPDIPFYYLYKDKKDIVTKIEQSQDIPVLYVFNKQQNRFLDDLYLFTISDQSYIMDKEEFSSEKLKEVFTNINLEKGLIIIINEGLEHETYLKEILETLHLRNYEHLQRMNACDIYQME